jgi:hypothetical protein
MATGRETAEDKEGSTRGSGGALNRAGTRLRRFRPEGRIGACGNLRRGVPV